MRSLLIQIQPDRSPTINMEALTELFQSIAASSMWVRGHSFDSGFDGGRYYNFRFNTDQPAALWALIQERIFHAPGHQQQMAEAAMALCSGERGWDDYLQLYHWDPKVPVVAVPAL